jgi:hypothetical protein
MRTIGFLALAAICVLTSNALDREGNGGYVLLTFIGTVVGLIGAGYCTVRGLKAMGLPGSGSRF